MRRAVLDCTAYVLTASLAPAFRAPWAATQVVEEDETVLAFAFALRKQAPAGGSGVSPLGMGLGKAKPKGKFK